MRLQGLGEFASDCSANMNDRRCVLLTLGDAALGTPIEHERAQFVPSWTHACRRIRDPRFVGIDLTWSEWLRLDEI